MVSDPERAKNHEAAREAESLRGKAFERRQQPLVGRSRPELGDMELEDEDRHGDSEDAIRERLHAIRGQPDECLRRPVALGSLHRAKIS